MRTSIDGAAGVGEAGRAMEFGSAFSYACNQCGRCCRDKVITLSPCDVIRIARAMRITTGEAIARYTIRRGSILRFDSDGRCAAAEGARCGIHRGRPLACRLYPLGIERATDKIADARFVRLEPATGSAGVYGEAGTIADFLAAQEVGPCLESIDAYAALLPRFGARVAQIVDYERVEPREFWRVARREALSETGYDPNPLIDAIFDADGCECGRVTLEATFDAQIAALTRMVEANRDAGCVAAAAVMLAVSLGRSPADVVVARS